MLKLTEKNLSLEEFIEKKKDVECNLEGETYWGQKENNRIIEGVTEAICYGENGEQKKFYYTENIAEDGTHSYNIYE